MSIMPLSTPLTHYLDAYGDIKWTDNYTEYDGEMELTTGWYVVRGEHNVTGRIYIIGDVNIILTDGAHLSSLTGGVNVDRGNSLTIYAQSTVSQNAGGMMGMLTAHGPPTILSIHDYGSSAIGGDYGRDGGSVIIRGGEIIAVATGVATFAGAGIGGGGGMRQGGRDADNILISGGIVYAENLGGGAAIGSGGGGSPAQPTPPTGNSFVTITGGHVTANSRGGAGIGGGNLVAGGTILIECGNITTRGGGAGAGIGG
jgi:hypothetical protein